MAIRNFLDANLEDCAKIHDGVGILKHKTTFGGSDFETPVKFLNYTILPPNTTIGLHTHGNDEELYIVLEGNGLMHDEGEVKEVKPGDIIVNKPFGTHGLENNSDNDIRILVLGVGMWYILTLPWNFHAVFL